MSDSNLAKPGCAKDKEIASDGVDARRLFCSALLEARQHTLPQQASGARRREESGDRRATTRQCRHSTTPCRSSSPRAPDALGVPSGAPMPRPMSCPCINSPGDAFHVAQEVSRARIRDARAAEGQQSKGRGDGRATAWQRRHSTPSRSWISPRGLTPLLRSSCP